MINRAREEGTTTSALATKYILEYFEDIDPLGVKRATAFPRATEHIEEMIDFIQKLVKASYAYETNGSVYFRVSKFKNYGKLSQHSQVTQEPDQDAGEASEKENPTDFVLWKKMKPDEPFWESPWGKGRPGWHIECSVMSTKYLGDTIDIHGGGMDLQFPHHENEIAQTEALTGKKWVRYWLHNGFLTVNREKMSKSLGNFFTIKEIRAKYDPEVIRLFLISSHYRSPIDFSDSQLEEAKSRFTRIHNAIDSLQQRWRTAREVEIKEPQKPSDLDQQLLEATNAFRKEFDRAMDDDFNTPVAFASFFTFLSRMNPILSGSDSLTAGTLQFVYETLDAIGEVLGVYRERMVQQRTDEEAGNVDNLVKLLIELREKARAKKDFDTADKIRTRLSELGIKLEDGKTGTTWKWG
jgi:cysteinyl-tRNA synthetase